MDLDSLERQLGKRSDGMQVWICCTCGGARFYGTGTPEREHALLTCQSGCGKPEWHEFSHRARDYGEVKKLREQTKKFWKQAEVTYK